MVVSTVLKGIRGKLLDSDTDNRQAVIKPAIIRDKYCRLKIGAQDIRVLVDVLQILQFLDSPDL